MKPAPKECFHPFVKFQLHPLCELPAALCSQLCQPAHAFNEERKTIPREEYYKKAKEVLFSIHSAIKQYNKKWKEVYHPQSTDLIRKDMKVSMLKELLRGLKIEHSAEEKTRNEVDRNLTCKDVFSFVQAQLNIKSSVQQSTEELQRIFKEAESKTSAKHKRSEQKESSLQSPTNTHAQLTPQKPSSREIFLEDQNSKLKNENSVLKRQFEAINQEKASLKRHLEEKSKKLIEQQSKFKEIMAELKFRRDTTAAKVTVEKAALESTQKERSQKNLQRESFDIFRVVTRKKLKTKGISGGIANMLSEAEKKIDHQETNRI